MVSGPAASDAIARAKRMERLRVGLHLVLIEGWPTLPPDTIPGLVDSAGVFRNDMVRVAFELAFRSDLKRQLADEIRAQFEAFRQTGLRLDHVNAHKHFQLHPIIAGQIVEIGREFGMQALRIPVEPPSARRALKESGRAAHRALRSWAGLIRRRVRAERVLVPDAVFGLAWTG